MTTNSAEGIRWDLSDLYAAHDDPRIDLTIKDCHARAERFADRFRALMQDHETLTAESLLQALKELEIIYESLGRVGSYAGLLYAADTAKPEYQDLTQRVEQRSTEIRNLLLFFELEWLKFDDTIASRLIGGPYIRSLPSLSHKPAPLSAAYAHRVGRKGHQRKRQHRAQCLRPAFFRDHVVADIRLRKAQAKKQTSISVRFSPCSTNPTARCGRAPWRRSIKVCLSRAKC